MKLIQFLRSVIFRQFNFKESPIDHGNKFIILGNDYLDKFDEVIVIGDIHGCSDEFEDLLKEVHSRHPLKDPNKCLKILVGDLVNKGPKSEKVLKLCRDIYPESILAVRGNHDEIVLEQYRQFEALKQSLEDKNKWIESLPSRYITYLASLPYSIRIPSFAAIIVHAGLNPLLREPAVDTPTQLMTTMRNIIVLTLEGGETRYECTKSDQVGSAWASLWPGPEHVYFGHDARRRLQDNHEFATGLDTGCVYGGSLTGLYIKGPQKGTYVTIKARMAYQPVSD